MKCSFKNDYSYIAHPRILDALNRYQGEYHGTYGLDKHSAQAAKYIKEVFACPQAEVHFLAGGTQTNMTFISYCLKLYEAVISCDSGHINVHETGAIEGSGHKIISIFNKNGKLTSPDIEKVINAHNNEHQVKPRLVYISNSTENGQVYYKQELFDLYNTCKKYGLLLFIDGARLGAALTAIDNDIKVNELAQLCDAFYIGGTKNGLLFGEALVITNKELQSDFRYHIKNKGAMLAKGYVVGIQFEELFKDGLYFDIAKNTNQLGKKLSDILIKHNLRPFQSSTNQIFVSLPKDKAYQLMDEFDLELWEENESDIVVRFVTSFATKEEDLSYLDSYLENL